MGNPEASSPRPKQKTNKKRRANPLKRLKGISKTILIFIACQVALVSTLYQMNAGYLAPNFGLNCNEATKKVFYSARVRKFTGKPISVNLVTNSISGSLKWISNTASAKQYGYYEPGSNCYYHSDNSVKDPMFILVIAKNGESTNKCKVVGIITEQDLQPCGGTATDDFFSYSPVQLNKADSTPAADLFNFERMLRNEDFESASYDAMYYYLYEFGVGDINEGVVEMIILNLFNSLMTNQPVIAYEDATLSQVNLYRHLNSFASEMKPETFIPRII